MVHFVTILSIVVLPPILIYCWQDVNPEQFPRCAFPPFFLTQCAFYIAGKYHNYILFRNDDDVVAARSSRVIKTKLGVKKVLFGKFERAQACPR
jgi:hypothetical protein